LTIPSAPCICGRATLHLPSHAQWVSTIFPHRDTAVSAKTHLGFSPPTQTIEIQVLTHRMRNGLARSSLIGTRLYRRKRTWDFHRRPKRSRFNYYPALLSTWGAAFDICPLSRCGTFKMQFRTQTLCHTSSWWIYHLEKQFPPSAAR
jgi:hypothetical protein